ncbi:hypothetical protein UFOVP354_55 [uncultured Caudovirales phage]|uniref:Uncharacterized protein n=1 Tax=uncultured Caudovirales phage TaxID=2100421 RepID=A0A6J5M391_9CAUD|nr:hypothetical protein UFOVP354_55 [uncultured Caudovirales phage]
MTTTVALNRPRVSPLWWMFTRGSLLAGAGIIAIAGFILATYVGHFAWVNWVSPRVEFLGVQAIQFAGKDIIAEPVQVAAVNPAMDNNTRLRNLDVELEQQIRRKP